MSLKLRLTALASAVTLAAGLAVALAVPAPASAGVLVGLCVTPENNPDFVYCAYEGSDGTGAKVRMGLDTAFGDTWSVPDPGPGQISDTNSGLCMAAVGGDWVEVENCGTATTQQWTPTSYPYDGYDYTVWTNGDGLCLNDDIYAGTGPSAGDGGELDVALCNYNFDPSAPNLNELFIQPVR
jgi:hypothetical protein